MGTIPFRYRTALGNKEISLEFAMMHRDDGCDDWKYIKIYVIKYVQYNIQHPSPHPPHPPEIQSIIHDGRCFCLVGPCNHDILSWARVKHRNNKVKPHTHQSNSIFMPRGRNLEKLDDVGEEYMVGKTCYPTVTNKATQ